LNALSTLVTIATVTVGNPGNPGDTIEFEGTFGAVGYVYAIAKHEVTARAAARRRSRGRLPSLPVAP
jgi:hypothetical protein